MTSCVRQYREDYPLSTRNVLRSCPNLIFHKEPTQVTQLRQIDSAVMGKRKVRGDTYAQNVRSSERY